MTWRIRRWLARSVYNARHGTAADMTETDPAGKTAPPSPTRWRRVCTNTKRVVTSASVAVAVYLLVGCWMFPDWWYSWLWQRQFVDLEYTTEGLHVLMDEYFWLVLTVVSLILVAGVLGRVFRNRLFRIIDEFGGIIIFGSAASVVVVFLFLYHTHHVDTPDTLDEISQLSERAQNQLRLISTPPAVVPPIDFDYINKERVDALYNQLEPDLEEKERTVAQTSTEQGKVGVAGGGVSGEVSAGKSANSTSSFSRTHFSQERECIEIMKYIADTYGSSRYYSTRDRWMQTRAATDDILRHAGEGQRRDHS